MPSHVLGNWQGKQIDSKGIICHGDREQHLCIPNEFHL